jgi:hypothetical protein
VPGGTWTRRLVTGAIMAVMLASIYGVAYALGVQSHTVNAVTHGCPFDPGCTGPNNNAGDYNKRGYNRCADPFPACPGDHDMNFSRTRVRLISNDVLKATSSCNNCIRVDVQYDTNPTWECKFETDHYSEGPALSLHDHFTESAIC